MIGAILHMSLEPLSLAVRDTGSFARSFLRSTDRLVSQLVM